MRSAVKRAIAILALGVAPLLAGPAGASDCKNGVCPDPGSSLQLTRANPDQPLTMSAGEGRRFHGFPGATTVAILLPVLVLLGAFLLIAISKSGVFLQLLKDKQSIRDSMKNR
ncbi:MAG: hypothetical protein KC777_03295 [Cyanobacteria bacterium HKST-UBA02]|nr:hypothetical protein [Cyanobacteria bacterium HKST-UBA02]